jgi:hypothetical protein
MHRRALLSLCASLALAGCTLTDELGVTGNDMRLPPEDRLYVVSRAETNLEVGFVIRDGDRTVLDEIRTVDPGQGFTLAEYLPRRGGVAFTLDIEGGTRFERGVGDHESFTVEIHDADTVELTDYVVV